jgi:hypothetical protein
VQAPGILNGGTDEDGPSTLPVGRSTPHAAPAVIDTKPLPAASRRRNGRVAGLPKVQRDMVNHMLWNGVPYKNIVAALDEADYKVTERQISSWATGGYLEWSLAQEHVLQNRLDQDHLLDFLRREDAPELPEVGLQAAATQLSQVLLQKLARGEDPEAHIDSYSKLVDLMVRLNREIAVSQKQRDDSRRTLGREYDPVLVKDEEQIEAIENERFYSNPPSDSTLSKPAEPPALPPIPTATFMAAQALEERECAAAERRKQSNKLWEACLASSKAAAKRRDESTSTPPPVGAR